MRTPILICLKLFKQVVRFALALALLKAGSNKAARIAMMTMTANSSIRVNPFAPLNLFLMPVGQCSGGWVTPPNVRTQARRDKGERSETAAWLAAGFIFLLPDAPRLAKTA